ncbi:hypothetical protein ACVXHB_02710 [Escherichia coli]
MKNELVYRICGGWLVDMTTEEFVECKKAIRQDGLLLNLMPGSLWRALPATLRLLLRNVQIRSRRICPTRRAFTDKQADKQKAEFFH